MLPPGTGGGRAGANRSPVQTPTLASCHFHLTVHIVILRSRLSSRAYIARSARFASDTLCTAKAITLSPQNARP